MLNVAANGALSILLGHWQAYDFPFARQRVLARDNVVLHGYSSLSSLDNRVNSR